MINLILLLIPVLLKNIHLFLFLFTALAIIRFRFNNKKLLFIVSIIGNAILFALPFFIKHPFPTKDVILFNFIVSFWGLGLNIKYKLWVKDIVSTSMEPILSLILISNLFGLFWPDIFPKLYNWLSLYFYIQISLILVKIYYSIKLSAILLSIKERLKLLIVYLRYIDPSFGLNELSSASHLHIIHPTTSDILIKEIEILNRKIFAIAKLDRQKIKDINKEYKNYVDKNSVEFENIVSFKRKNPADQNTHIESENNMTGTEE